MMVYQMHPAHGRHIAYTSLEVDDNIKHGWKTVTKEEFYAVPEAKKKLLAEQAAVTPKEKTEKAATSKKPKKKNGKKDPLK